MARHRSRDHTTRRFVAEFGSVRLLLVVIFVSVFAGGVTWFAFPGDDFENLRQCARCEDVIQQDDCVSGIAYWSCRKCSVTAGAAGACPKCKQNLKQRVAGNLACPTCYGPTKNLKED